jgi:hypothetical protein
MADGMDRLQRRRPRLKLWHIGVGLVCLAVAGVLMMRWHWRYEFHRQIEAIRAAGLPVTWQELDAWYPWPSSGRNAADWVLGAEDCCWRLTAADARRLEQIVSRSTTGLGLEEPLPDDLKALLERHIESNAKALALLHEVGTDFEGRYPVDLSKGWAASTRHITSVRDSVTLLGLEAALCAEHQDPNGTTRALQAALFVAASVDKEPLLSSHTVRMWGSVWAAWALERALRHVEFTEGQLARLHQAFGDIRGSDGLRRALVGNRCMFLSAFEQSTSLDPRAFGRLPPVPILEAYDALGLSAREGTAFLDYVQECIRIADLPAFQRLQASRNADARYLCRPDALLLSKMASMSGLMRQETRAVAWLETAATALAAERYRLGQGRFPDAVDQLVPDYLAAVPVDPFDGAPLRYRRADRGFVVHSVGEDGRDDGGQGHRPTGGGKSDASGYDITFTVER